MFPTISLVSIHHHAWLKAKFFFMMRTFEIYSLSNFQTYNTVLLTIVTMASGPITSWEIDGETVTDFILGGSKITEDGDCRHEIKRHLLLGRKVMTNLGHRL